MQDESPPPEMLEYLSRIGKKYGASGGRAAARNLSAAARKRRAKKASVAAAKALTPKQRKERASKAAQTRWAKKREKPGR